MRGRFLLLCAAFSLSACTSELGPTQAELRAQWDAQNVTPQNYKSDLIAFLRTYLNNPEGVRGASVSAPASMHVGQGERYVACVRDNARDMVGKYAGQKEGAAVFASASSSATSTSRPRRRSCARAQPTRRSRSWRR